MHGRFRVNPVTAILPQDISGLAAAAQWISMKYYRQCTILITQAGWAGGTPAVTLSQAQDVSGTNPKALEFSTRYQQATNTGGTGFVAAAVTNNTFNLPNTPNQNHLIEVDAASLDVDNGYDCLKLNVASPGINADVLQAVYLLTGPRYGDTKMPNALAD